MVLWVSMFNAGEALGKIGNNFAGWIGWLYLLLSTLASYAGTSQATMLKKHATL